MNWMLKNNFNVFFKKSWRTRGTLNRHFAIHKSSDSLSIKIIWNLLVLFKMYWLFYLKKFNYKRIDCSRESIVVHTRLSMSSLSKIKGGGLTYDLNLDKKLHWFDSLRSVYHFWLEVTMHATFYFLLWSRSWTNRYMHILA